MHWIILYFYDIVSWTTGNIGGDTKHRKKGSGRDYGLVLAMFESLLLSYICLGGVGRQIRVMPLLQPSWMCLVSWGSSSCLSSRKHPRLATTMLFNGDIGEPRHPLRSVSQLPQMIRVRYCCYSEITERKASSGSHGYDDLCAMRFGQNHGAVIISDQSCF